MNVIWKFVLTPKMVQMVRMPRGAKIVHVGEQFNAPVIWVLCDPHAPTEDRKIGTLTTGQYFDAAEMQYCGTFMLNGGQFVGHIMEPKVG